MAERLATNRLVRLRIGDRRTETIKRNRLFLLVLGTESRTELDPLPPRIGLFCVLPQAALLAPEQATKSCSGA